MKLSKLQLKALQNSVKWKESPPSFIKLAKAMFISKCAIPYLVIFGYSAFVWWGGWQVVAAVFAGVGIGFLFRDISTIKVTLKLWSVNNEITNWQKVNELIQVNEVQNTSEI